MLGKKGLTSAEAQRFANFIKELIKGQDINIDSFKVITSKALKDGAEMPLDTNVKINNWSEMLVEKANYYALSAWLMEAVKQKVARETEKRAELFTSSMISEDMIKYPDHPVKPDLTFDTFFKTLTVKEQSNYLTQESIAAHIGKFIHNFDKVREQLDTYQPTTFKPISTTETLTVLHTELYDRVELLADVESLQGKHRAATKEVNAILARHGVWVADRERDYQIALAKYQSDYSVVSATNNAIAQKYKSEFENQKTKELQEIRNLKIVIPIDLQPIVDMVKRKLDAANKQE